MAVRFSKQLEVQVLSQLFHHPDDHITFPPEAYRDGVVTIYRNGLRHRLPRYLATTIYGVNDLPFMLPACSTKGCQNPNHFEFTSKPYRQRRTCPNGHEYTPKNTLPLNHRFRCRKCRDDYNARRRKGTGPIPSKNLCQNNHRMTEDNVYTWTDPITGTKHRRCRRCMRDYQNARRQEKR